VFLCAKSFEVGGEGKSKGETFFHLHCPSLVESTSSAAVFVGGVVKTRI